MHFSKADSSAANGTHLQGRITTTFVALENVFGRPHDTDGDKTTVEWAFKFTDGTVATVYDYKYYFGSVSAIRAAGEVDFSVGGHGPQAFRRICDALDERDVKYTPRAM
jgi:hypothetical protein